MTADLKTLCVGPALKAVTISRDDRLTEPTAQSIEQRNVAGAALCGSSKAKG